MSTSQDPGRREKVVEELKSTLLIFIYLAVFFGAFTTYRRLVLAEYRIPFFHYGYSLIEAMVLAKVIVLGRFLKLGERYNDRPLVVPTLYKTIWFGGLIGAFSVLEHLITGWIHGESTGEALRKLLDMGAWEILSQALVKFLALLPMFAAGEIDRVLGRGTLFHLFFNGRAVPDSEAAEEVASAAARVAPETP
ncbi:MAG: hypothetical protein U0800_20710 [Isosphaeraceae bacterium]